MDERHADQTGRLVPGSVQLTTAQWRWLQDRSRKNYSRSVSAEVRVIVAEAMEREKQQSEAKLVA